MAGWQDSDRKSRLPDDWEYRRQFVRNRAGGRCEQIQEDGTRCPMFGTDCDHVDRGDNHDFSNLEWLCSSHHAAKSAMEGVEARAAKKLRGLRPVERHPGLLTPEEATHANTDQAPGREAEQKRSFFG